MSGQHVTTRPARGWRTAAAILAERDPVLHRLVAEVGPARVRPPAETHFEALARAIVYQQLAGADVPDVPASAAGRVANGRSWGEEGVRAGMADPDSDGEAARAARRPVPAVPFGRGLVLLACRRDLRRHGRQRPHSLTGRIHRGTRRWCHGEDP